MSSSLPKTRFLPEPESLGLWAAYYLSVLLIAIGAFSGFAGGRTWGFDWWSYFPLTFFSIVLPLLLALPAIMIRIRGLAVQRDTSTAAFGGWAIFATTTIAISILVALWWGFRNKTFFLGDGYQVLSQVTNPDASNHFWKILPKAIARATLVLVNDTSTEGARLALQLVSVVSGAISLAAVGFLGFRMKWGQTLILLIMLVVATSGVSLLFFGYVEYYPPLVAALFLAVVLGILAAEGLMSAWWCLLMTIIAVALHPFAVGVLPAAVYLLIKNTSIASRFNKMQRSIKFIVAALVLGLLTTGIVVWAAQSYQLRFMFVPPVRDEFTADGYTLFSVKHLADTANLLFMLLPSLGIVAYLFYKVRKQIWNSPAVRYLTAGIAPSLAIVFIFDPRLGMYRDWDLFGFVGVPVALLAACVLTKAQSSMRSTVRVALLSIVLNVTLLAPRVSVLMMEQPSLAMVRKITALDHAKAKNLQYIVQDYYRKFKADTTRVDSLVSTLKSEYPEIAFHERALNFQTLRMYDSAIDCARRAIELNPIYPEPYGVLCVSNVWLRRPAVALRYGLIEAGMNPGSPGAGYDLALVYISNGDLPNAKKYLDQSLAEDPAYGPAIYGEAFVSLNSDDLASARKYIERLGSARKVEENHFEDLLNQCMSRGWVDLGGQVLASWRKSGIDSATLESTVARYPQLKGL